MATRAAPKRAMRLEVFGQQLTVRSDTDEKTVRAIVDFVNERLDVIQRSARRIPTEQIALMCALNIAEELFAERAAHAELKATVRVGSDKLLRLIDGLSEADAP